MGEGLLMKLWEVKELLGVGRETVYRMAKDGDIKPVRIGSQVMYERESVQRWIQENVQEPGGA